MYLFIVQKLQLSSVMEVDINQAKSRAFNLFLRFLQLGIQIFIASEISLIDHNSCSYTFVTIAVPISLILVGLNFIFILVIRCRENFPRIPFFVALAADVIMGGVLMVMGFAEIGESNSCANNKIVHRFAGFSALFCMILCIGVMRLPFELSQRYTNTPGNAVWIFLFFGFGWTHLFAGSLITIGIFNLIITLSSVIVNLVPFLTGMTSRMKKILLFQWLGALGLMVICEVIALAVYLSNSDASQFNDVVAKKLLETYLPINVIDGLFWVWGLLTLAYANGDKIRDMLLSEGEGGGNDEQAQEEQNDQGYNMGTIK